MRNLEAGDTVYTLESYPHTVYTLVGRSGGKWILNPDKYSVDTKKLITAYDFDIHLTSQVDSFLKDNSLLTILSHQISNKEAHSKIKKLENSIKKIKTNMLTIFMIQTIMAVGFIITLRSLL